MHSLNVPNRYERVGREVRLDVVLGFVVRRTEKTAVSEGLELQIDNIDFMVAVEVKPEAGPVPDHFPCVRDAAARLLVPLAVLIREGAGDRPKRPVRILIWVVRIRALV